MKNTDEILYPTHIEIGNLILLLPKLKHPHYELYAPYKDTDTHIVRDGFPLCRAGIWKKYKPPYQIKLSVANKTPKKKLESFVCKRCLATYYRNLAKKNSELVIEEL